MRPPAIYFILLALSLCGCKKSPPGTVQPTPAVQYPLLSKLTLTNGGKTYTDTYTYDTTGTFKNNPIELRSEIAGKLIRFSYAQDIYFRVTLDKVYEYDINTNQLLDTYQYDGYNVQEPGIPPIEKDVYVTDVNNKLIKKYSFYKQDIDSVVEYITFGTDTVHLSSDSNKNLILYDTGNASGKIAYTYDTQHNPLSLLGAENEHLGYALYATPQTFANNPVSITIGGATKTYTYQYNQYGYPVNAKVTDGTNYKYEYVSRW